MADEDSWDDEDFDIEKGFAGDEEFKDEDKDLNLDVINEPEPEKTSDKPSKTKDERIAEKKALRRAAEQEAEAAAKASAKTITDNEERLRREKLQKESDLELAMETFGVSDSSGGGGGGLESSNPSTDEDFTSFGNSLTDLIVKFETSPHYTKFIEKLIVKCCGGLDAEDLRHISTVLSTMATEKQKGKTKTPKKKGGKASLGTRAVGKASKKMTDLDYDNDFGAEFDDFM